MVLGVLVLSVFCSCGYTLSHRLNKEFKGYSGFFVPVFRNETEEVGAEVPFTNALIREMESHGERVVSSRDEDIIEIRGAIDGLDYRPSSLTGVGALGLHKHVRIPDAIGVTVRVSLMMVDTKTKKTIWKKSFSGALSTYAPKNRTYDVDAPSTFGTMTQSLVESTYADIARVMMRDVYDSMVDFF